jgi:hypothetical protein
MADEYVIGAGYNLFSWALFIITAFSLLIQIYLVYLIVVVTPKSMFDYRKYLAQIAVSRVNS